MAWHAHDTEPPLTGVAGVDLTAAPAVVVHVLRPDSTLITRAATIPASTIGAWSLSWQTSELDTVGAYESEIEVTWSEGRVQTFAGPSFRVHPQLDDAGLPWVAPDVIIDGGTP